MEPPKEKRVFILFQGHFFNICFLFQCIVYSINFQNIYTFAYQKAFLCKLLLLVFKIVESLKCIFKLVKFRNIHYLVQVISSYVNFLSLFVRFLRNFFLHYCLVKQSHFFVNWFCYLHRNMLFFGWQKFAARKLFKIIKRAHIYLNPK